MFDMFSSFFGGGGPQQQEVRRRPMTTSDFEVSLEDMYKGVEIDFMINIKVFCDHFCVGGLAHPDVSHMLVPHMQHYALNVPMGIAEGSEFVFEGEGDESPDWEAGTSLYASWVLLDFGTKLIERKRQKSAPRLLIISNLGTEKLLLLCPDFAQIVFSAATININEKNVQPQKNPKQLITTSTGVVGGDEEKNNGCQKQ
ncbi:hypothetical protein JB92DRAFT_3227982 [Gautieria morchelliformis]|nr:hypothetical protein JB92DRAFT_3227982 [Gautieria morchelliformis]